MWSEEEKATAIETICRELALGRPLIKICEDPDMPGYSTVLAWRTADPTFQEMYARAREEQADWHAEQILIIADTEDDPNKARVRIDARKWAAAKLKPKVYGDRLNIEQDLTVRVSPEQRRARIEQLISKAADAGYVGADRTGAGRATDAPRGGGNISSSDENVLPLSGHRPSAA